MKQYESFTLEEKRLFCRTLVRMVQHDPRITWQKIEGGAVEGLGRAHAWTTRANRELRLWFDEPFTHDQPVQLLGLFRRGDKAAYRHEG